MRLQPRLIFLSLLLLALPFATNASAQTTHVYVANSGDDINQCTASAPCKTVAKGLSIVDAGGEVIITENGDYDPFYVQKSVTVAAAPGINAAIVASAANAIWAVLTPADTVTFRNLNLKKIGADPQVIGIYNSKGGAMYVDGCTLTGFTTAILTTNGAGNVFIHNTVLRENTLGMSLVGPQTEGVLRIVIEGCKLEFNYVGIAVSHRVVATIRDSIIANQGSHGIVVRPFVAHQRAEALVDNCLITGNTIGIAAFGNGGLAVVRLTRSTITNNVLDGVQLSSLGATVYTLQNNTITGNVTDVNGGQLTPLQPK